MILILIGVNHKTAPLAVRERLSLLSLNGDSRSVLAAVMNLPGVKEAYVLSTCNRFEILVSADDPEKAVAALRAFMASSEDVDSQDIEDCIYVHRDQEAVRHLFRVASGLDSMVMGEPQIFGQVKEAYRMATEHKSAGPVLNKLLHSAFRVAKRVRTETGIAENAVSVSFASVELAKKIFGNLAGKTILLIGAGEMTELAARHLVNQKIGKILVVNRTLERAVKLAEEFHGRPMAFDMIEEALSEADIVISSTGSPSYLVTKEMIGAALHRRKNRLMFIIDVAVPRDVDPAVAKIDNVYLYNIDDLQDVVDENLKTRLAEAQKGEGIIGAEVTAFFNRLQTLEMVPTIVALRKKMEDVVREEMEKNQVWLKELDPENREHIRIMTEAIVNKMLHDPITCLKKENNGDDSAAYAEAVRELFKLV